MSQKLIFDMWFNVDYSLCIVLIGVTLIGATSGSLGCFAFLREQSLLGDAISHAALPGIALMFLYTQTKNPSILLCGGAIAGIIGALLVTLIVAKTPIKKDAALGIVLSVFFGFGLVILTYIQKHSFPHQAVLNKFLFGNASTLLIEDIYLIIAISVVLMLALIVLWKETMLFTFDPLFAKTIGYPLWILDSFLIVLLVLAIVIGLQTVGVILMSTLFIAPAAAAYQWTARLKIMLVLAGFFGAFSSALGAFVSSSCERIPTGPIIVVIMSIIVLISLLIAPYRGFLWQMQQKG